MKETLYLLLSACFCLSATTTFAAPIRSALGSDGTEFSEEEDWENPYITDGLVAMWDGRWNVGGGMHDESSAEWIDLIRGTAIPVENARLSFKRDALRFTSFGGLASFSSETTPIVSDSHTIEVVCRVVEMPDAPGGNSSLVVLSNYEIRIPYIASTGAMSIFYSTVGQPSLGINAIGGGISLSLAMVTNLETKKVLIYNGGELARQINKTGYAMTSTNMRIFDSLTGSGWAAGTVLEICCIRVYDRALIPGEVLFNYNLDKKRFGL